DEGTKILDSVLRSEMCAHLVISTGDLEARLNQWTKPGAARGRKESQTVVTTSLHPRPDLPNAYVGPRNEIEGKIAGLWQDALGIEQIGVFDNFFELGGHSLLVTQVVSRVREIYQADIPLRAVFEQLTVAGLARVVEDVFVKELDGLSEEEAEQLLA